MKRIVLAIVFAMLLTGMAWAAEPPTGPWHPEITERPRLLFGPEDLSEMQSRVLREPYTTMMNRVRSRANAGFDPTLPDPYNAGREYGLANIAKAAAFVAWIDDDATKADKAASVLEAMAVDFGNMFAQLQQDIHIGEALMNYAVAFDILAGTGLIEQTRLDAIEERLSTMVENLYAGFFDQWAAYQIISVNNHSTKINSALAIAAMALNQHDDANKWFNLGASDTIYKTFEKLITEEGANTEGTYYATYAAVNHLPFFVMFDRLIGDDVTLLKRGFCLIGPDCPWNEYPVVNPVDHPKTLAMAEWMIKIRMPDGGYPPVDDANIEGHFNGILVGPLQNGLLAWDWVENPTFPLFYQHCADIDVDLIAMYDDSVEIAPPNEDFGLNFIMPEAGNAAFRSGWGEDDTWMLFFAENGQARKLGGGHEHADNLSVSLYARNEYLLIDPGYINWENHQVVRLGEHHNLPTVDGKGPKAPSAITQMGGDDAFIVDGAADSFVPFVRGQSTYQKASFDRVVFFPESDYLIAIDDMHASEPRTFGVLWHGQAGSDSGYPFTLLDDGGRWERDAAAADVHVQTNAGDLDITTKTNIHGFVYGTPVEHTSLDVRADETARHARFISVGFPYDLISEDPRAVIWLHHGDMVAARIDSDEPLFVMARNYPLMKNLSAADTGSLAVRTDATTLLLASDETGSQGYGYAQGGMHLELGDLRTWAFGYDNGFWFEWTGEIWDLHFPHGGNTLVTECVSQPGVEAGAGVEWEYQNGRLTIWSEGEAWARVTFGWEKPAVKPAYLR